MTLPIAAAGVGGAGAALGAGGGDAALGDSGSGEQPAKTAQVVATNRVV
jgi:hypothetical protein